MVATPYLYAEEPCHVGPFQGRKCLPQTPVLQRVAVYCSLTCRKGERLRQQIGQNKLALCCWSVLHFIAVCCSVLYGIAACDSVRVWQEVERLRLEVEENKLRSPIPNGTSDRVLQHVAA